jgi:hypothetical protein
MKNQCLAAFASVCSVVLASSFTGKGEITLFELALNQDGIVSSVAPSGSVFDTSTGLGTIRMDFTGSGQHEGYAFFDHELSETVNGFANEFGTVSGIPSAGESWEIDEPGFPSGDVYDHFVAGALDNTVSPAGPADVAMAMGWSFILGPSETGEISFLLSTVPPAGFHLRHHDPDSAEAVFLSSSLTIRSASIPEGGSVPAYATLSAVMLVASMWRCRPGPGKSLAFPDDFCQ